MAWNAFGPYDAPCEILNHGATKQHWIGAADGGVKSLYGVHFNRDAFPAEWVSIESAEIKVELTFLEQGIGEIGVFPVSSGDGGNWVAGELDGQIPEVNDDASTYKYQYYGDALAWPNGSVMSVMGGVIGTTGLQGLQGPQVAVQLDPDKMGAWLDDDAENGFILTAGSPALDTVLTSNEGTNVPLLYMNICYYP